MTAPQHTTTPYQAMQKEGHNTIIFKSDRIMPVGDEPALATVKRFEDAAFIVRACNAHDKLVEALELIQGYDWRLTVDAHSAEIIRRAEAALKLARGE